MWPWNQPADGSKQQRMKNPTACNRERWGRNREEADLIPNYSRQVIQSSLPKTCFPGSDMNLFDNVFDLIKFRPRVQLLSKNFEKSTCEHEGGGPCYPANWEGELAHSRAPSSIGAARWFAVNMHMFSVPVALGLTVEKSAPFGQTPSMMLPLAY
jgi:hypothetical protein